MKLVIASPSTGAVKTVEVEDDVLRRTNLGDYRMGNEIGGEIFGQAFSGYKFRISGGQDKDGFPMKQGVMSNARVRLLLTPGTTGYQAWRARTGERKRRSVRGCILGSDLATISLVVIEKGQKEIEGLTDVSFPMRLGPKRANKIRKLFGLTNQVVTKYVVRRKLPEKTRNGKTRAYSKAPKIQRLIVPAILKRRAAKLQDKKARLASSAEERKNYISLILANRRDSRLKRASEDARSKKRQLKKAYTEISEARRKAYEKANKKAPAKAPAAKKAAAPVKAAAPAAKPAAKTAKK